MSMRSLRPFRSRTTVAEARAARAAGAPPLRAESAAGWRCRGSLHLGVTQVNIMAVVPYIVPYIKYERDRVLKHTEMLRDQRLVDLYLVDAAAEDNTPGVEHDHIIGETERELDVLFYQHDRLAVLLEARDRAADLGNDQWCQALGRLVHEQHARIAHQGAPDRQHLLLAAGEETGGLVQALLQPRKKITYPFERPGFRAAVTRLPRHRQVFAHRERRENAPPLRNEAHTPARDGFRR